jgi:hypothetical protein
MCLRFVFLLITRAVAGLQLSRREEAWMTAEILMLRHQLAVLQRRQPRPCGAENLCEQAILVNHAAGAVTALDAELIQIGDAVG